MLRDFSDENKKRVLDCLATIEDDTIWEKVHLFFAELTLMFSKLLDELFNFIVNCILRKKDNPSSSELNNYYTLVLIKNKELRSAIENVFSVANAADDRYAAYADDLLDSGNKILKEIKYLESVVRAGSYAELDPNPPTIICGYGHSKKALTDEEVVVKATGEFDKGFYLELITTGNEFLQYFDGVTLALIAIFKAKDVSIDKLVSLFESSNDIKITAIKLTLDKKCEFFDIDSIAEELGIDKKFIVNYLKNNGKTKFDNFLDQEEFYEALKNSKLISKDELSFGSMVNSLVALGFSKSIHDNEKLKVISKELGCDYKAIEAATSENYDPYTKNLYMQNIKTLFEKECGTNEYYDDIEDEFDDFSKITKAISKNYSFWEKYTSSGKKLEDMWSNDILSDPEARSFLKDCFGYETVSAGDIECLRKVTSELNSLGNVSKYLNYGDKVCEQISHLFADYTVEKKRIRYLIDNVSSDADPNYIGALYNLEYDYTHNFEKLFSDLSEEAVKTIVDKGLDEIPGLGTVFKVIDGIGESTGATSYSESAINLLAYPEICESSLNAYENAMNAIKNGDTSQEAVESARFNFSMYKGTMENYYKECMQFFDGMEDGSKADLNRKLYYKALLEKIQDMQMGDTFEYESFDDYFINP